MTDFVFPAIITYGRSDRAYTVSFPDLPGCVTFGDTL
ncbi:MAG: type II toxin-antitoxin system HicB family antitoxin, partial [Nitrospiria bacterium]